MINRHPYKNLPPDLWSECLHYLPPNELSLHSRLLPLADSDAQPSPDLRPEVVAEQAAWMAVGSKITIAQDYWSEIVRTETPSETDDDVILHEIVESDTSIIGNILRKTKSNPDVLRFVRYQDETWEDLYYLLHVLSETVVEKEIEDDDDATTLVGESEDKDDEAAVDCDRECVALAVGLMFGGLPPSFIMTSKRRKKLASIAETGCFAEKNDSGDENYGDRNTRHKISDARSCLMSQRLGAAGMWDTATLFLQSTLNRSNFLVDQQFDKNEEQNISMLMIDVMIYASKFLIDKLYSQTYVRSHGQDNEDLFAAVKYGRMAYKESEKRYNALRTLQTQKSTPIEEMGWWVSDASESMKNSSLTPPPPIDSLFGNDPLRYIHSGVALTRAMSLLAQHIGLEATKITDLNVFPSNYEEKESINLQPRTRAMVTHSIRIWNGFFADGQIIFEKAYQAIEDQVLISDRSLLEFRKRLNATVSSRKSVEEKSRLLHESTMLDLSRQLWPLSALITSSTNHEVLYCMSSVLEWYGADSKSCACQSIRGFSKTFRNTMKALCQTRVDSDDDNYEIPRLLQVLIGCAKDFGKTCAFARNRLGVPDEDFREGDSGGLLPSRNPEKDYLEVAYLVSAYTIGSSHPTTQNIRRLMNNNRVRGNADDSDDRMVGDSVKDIYSRVIPWLVEAYCTEQHD